MNGTQNRPDGRTQTVAVVRDFLSALETGEIDAATAHLHPTIVWHNVSLPKIVGIRRVNRILHGMERYSIGFEARLHHIAGTESAVLTERTDVLQWRRFRMEFWVCGTFEIEDGRIAVWRDYFSAKNFAWAMLLGLVRSVRS
ncbi:limonene-1,2-epoxide hydrolase family protein [Rhodococcus sp. NPDC058521]|uniref:limonene-1,2-epoxide hydrolase family protein n=1 Tax=Rhodococcus sp. NPDC058521 TaxID=3346536 RepID=UPI003652098C